MFRFNGKGIATSELQLFTFPLPHHGKKIIITPIMNMEIAVPIKFSIHSKGRLLL